MSHIDVSDHAQTLALVRESIEELERQQAQAINKAMDYGMRTDEYEGFDARRRKIGKLKKIVESAMLEAPK